ncbi:MAG: nucleoside deaminase [Planctomycetota bacterium]
MTPPTPADPLTPAAADRDHAMMRLALGQAQLAAEMGEVPVGAVVYHLATGRVAGAGHNLRETQADPTAHAEVLALRQAAADRGLWRLEGYGLAVTLEPCPMCAGAIVNARLSELVYAAPDPKMGCVDTLHRLCAEPRFNHRLATRAGVLADEAAQLLRDFFAARRGPDRPAKPRPPGRTP